MPKINIEFDLPEDREDFDIALNAVNWRSVVVEMHEQLRSAAKYSGDDEAGKWMERLAVIMEENKVDFV